MTIPKIDQLFKEHGYKDYKTCFWLVSGLGLDESSKVVRNYYDIRGIMKFIIDVDKIELFYEHYDEVLTIDVFELPRGENVGGFG